MFTINGTKIKPMTWKLLLETLDGAGLVITDFDQINDVLDSFGTGLDEPTCALEVMEL